MTTAPLNPIQTAPTLERDAAIERKLAQAWRKEQAVVHGRGLSAIVLGTAGLILAFLALDWVLLLPGSVRLVLVLTGIGSLGWVAYRQWWSRVRPYDRLRTALRVERRYPELASVLVSYVQLEDDVAAHSPRLVAAMRRHAVAQAEPLAFTEIVDASVARKLARWAAVGLVALGVLSVLLPQVMSTLLVRMINPFATVSYPTRTRIVSITGDTITAAGSSLQLSAETSGVTPPEGTLLLRVDGGDWEEGRIPAAETPNTFAYDLSAALESFDYYVRLGDATSATHRVTVVPAPAPRRIEVAITPPEYAGIDERIVDSLNFQSLAGSKVTWRLWFEQPLRQAQMLIDGGEATELPLDESGKVATLQLPAEESFGYRLRWTEREHGFAFDDGVQYRVQVVPDRPPAVNLLSPRDDAPGTLRKTVSIAFSASDDYGLREAWIVYQVNDGEEQRKSIEAMTGTSGERRLDWRPSDDIPLREGDVLSWSIAVADNGRDDRGNPNVGRSAARRLFVMSEPEYLAWIAERKGEIFGTLQEVRGSQIEAADEIETIRQLTPGAVPNNEGELSP